MPCAMTVAIAAPRTPMPKVRINSRSSTMFTSDEKIRNTSGMKLLPIARSRPEHRL